MIEMYYRKLFKVGHSVVLAIPKQILDKMSLCRGDILNLYCTETSLFITKPPPALRVGERKVR